MALPQTESPPSLDVIPPYFPGWKGSFVIGTIAGMLSVPAVEVTTSLKLVNIRNKRKQSRFARLTRLFRVSGVPSGLYFVALSGVFNYLTDKRGVVDLHNFAASGAVAGGAVGLMGRPPFYPPSMRYRRVPTAMVFSVCDGLISYPLGWVYMKLVEKLVEKQRQIKEGEREHCDEAHMKNQEAV